MISAILLAAGQSKRMNGENKLTKKINGVPLINLSILNILESSIEELIIVTGYQNEILESIINKDNKIKIFFNNHYKSGMASSIKVGVSNLSKKSKAFFICLGDMPYVNRKIYEQLIKHANDKEIIIPTYNAKQGNPVLFSIKMKNKIMNVEGDLGAKELLKKYKDKVFNLPIDDSSILTNLNTIDSFKN
tara:strand:+ start:103 stop:672 length:570 start_codon:yes stop_codon:yes gene_type:complete